MILTGYLSGILPWLFTARTAVFHFYAVVLTPFSALALALVLAALCRPDGGEVMRLAGVRLDGAPASVFGRRIAVLIFLTFAAVLAVLFFPLWSGISVADWFSRAHMWLPGWH